LPETPVEDLKEPADIAGSFHLVVTIPRQLWIFTLSHGGNLDRRYDESNRPALAVQAQLKREK
jgi:hypothetical protein